MHPITKTMTSQEANRHYRDLYRYNPWVSSVIDMWIDLMFPARLVLDGIHDAVSANYYGKVVADSGVTDALPNLMIDYLVLGRFVACLLDDPTRGLWTGCVQHDPDYCSFTFCPSCKEPRISLSPTAEDTEWANSLDPRIVKLRADMSPDVVHALASGKAVAPPPANTLFMARCAHATDYYGTSFLAGVDPHAMSLVEVLLRLHVDVAKIRDERAFNSHYVEAATRLRDHVSDYIFTQKMFPHVSADHGYKLIPTVEWAPIDGAKSPRAIVMEAVESVGIPMDELEQQQRDIVLH